MGKLVNDLLRAMTNEKDVSLIRYNKKDKRETRRLLELVEEFLSTENPDDTPERLMEKGVTLLIQYRGVIMGFLNYKKFKGNYWHICAFGIAKAVRRQGVGESALKHFIKQVLDDEPKARIMLGVNPGNKAARTLYLKLGFEVIDTGTEDGMPFELMCYRNQN